MSTVTAQIRSRGMTPELARASAGRAVSSVRDAVDPGTMQRETARQMAGVATFGVREWIAQERAAVTSDRRSDNRLIAAGQAGGDIVNTMLVIVIAVVVGYVGVKAAAETEDSVTDTDLASTNAENQTGFENATESLTSGFSGAMDLTEVVFIILMLSVIILALVGLRGRR